MSNVRHELQGIRGNVWGLREDITCIDKSVQGFHSDYQRDFSQMAQMQCLIFEMQYPRVDLPPYFRGLYGGAGGSGSRSHRGDDED